MFLFRFAYKRPYWKVETNFPVQNECLNFCFVKQNYDVDTWRKQCQQYQQNRTSNLIKNRTRLQIHNTEDKKNIKCINTQNTRSETKRLSYVFSLTLKNKIRFMVLLKNNNYKNMGRKIYLHTHVKWKCNGRSNGETGIA